MVSSRSWLGKRALNFVGWQLPSLLLTWLALLGLSVWFCLYLPSCLCAKDKRTASGFRKPGERGGAWLQCLTSSRCSAQVCCMNRCEQRAGHDACCDHCYVPTIQEDRQGQARALRTPDSPGVYNSACHSKGHRSTGEWSDVGCILGSRMSSSCESYFLHQNLCLVTFSRAVSVCWVGVRNICWFND